MLILCVVIEDIIRPNEHSIFKSKKSDRFYSNLMKIITVIFGLCCVAFSYMAANLDGLFQSALSLSGLLSGPVFAIFLLGFFNPWAEAIGVIIGISLQKYFAFRNWEYLILVKKESYSLLDDGVNGTLINYRNFMFRCNLTLY